MNVHLKNKHWVHCKYLKDKNENKTLFTAAGEKRL